MVAGKLLVRAMYPGTGSVRVLLVGRLIRRERSAARATMNTASSEQKMRRTMAVIFFKVKSLRGFYHLVLGRSKRSLGGFVLSRMSRINSEECLLSLRSANREQHH